MVSSLLRKLRPLMRDHPEWATQPASTNATIANSTAEQSRSRMTARRRGCTGNAWMTGGPSTTIGYRGLEALLTSMCDFYLQSRRFCAELFSAEFFPPYNNAPIAINHV